MPVCKFCDPAPAPFSRRRFMLGAALTVAASARLLSPARAAEPTLNAPVPNAIAPEAALQRLLQGKTSAPWQGVLHS